MKFFDRAEVKDMLAYLCVLNNPWTTCGAADHQQPARGIGATTLDKVGALAGEQGASLYEIIRNADLFPELKASSAKLLKFADLIDGLRRAGTELALPEFYDAVCDQTGYVKALEEKNDMESRGRIENVQELKSNILGFLEQRPEDATLSGFLNRDCPVHRSGQRGGQRRLRHHDDHSLRQGAGVPGGVRGGDGGGSSPAPPPSTTRRSWRRSGGSATWP